MKEILKTTLAALGIILLYGGSKEYIGSLYTRYPILMIILGLLLFIGAPTIVKKIYGGN